MELYPHERKRLDCLEGELRGDAPDLAFKFDVFTRLARGDGKPPEEGQFLAAGPSREAALAREGLRRYLLTIAAVVLTVATALIVLSFT
jgi:hypothetical protein